MDFACFGKLRDLEAIALAGFDGAELDLCELRALSGPELETLRKRLEGLGLRVCACSWIMENTVPIWSPDFCRNGWLRRFEDDAARLRALGCPVAVFAAGPIRRVGRDERSEEKKRLVMSFIRDAAGVFESQGVDMAVETVCYDYTDYLTKLRETAALRGDNGAPLRMLTDIRHLVRAGDEPDDILRYAQRIIHAHIDDPIPEKRLMPLPGDGYDYEPFLRRVLQTRADWLSWECHDEPRFSENAPRSLQYIRSIIKSLSASGNSPEAGSGKEEI